MSGAFSSHPDMNTRAALLPAIALLALSILLWRQFSLESDIESLRAELRALPRIEASSATAAPAPMPLPGDAGIASFRDALAGLESRIDELENVSSDTAKILNKALDEKEARLAAMPKPSWSAAQATGAPDTAAAGDQASAWAPAAQDGGEEWLELTYAEPVEVAQVLVRETYNPGAISKVCVILENGVELPIWQGAQDTVPGPIDRIFPAPGGLKARGAKVWLDTKRVPGWNEIDAVALMDRGGTRHWAVQASASSSYGGSGFRNGLFRSYIGGGDGLLFEGVR